MVGSLSPHWQSPVPSVTAAEETLGSAPHSGCHPHITYHFLELFLLAHLHHDQPFLHQAQAHVPLGIRELQRDVGAAGAQVLHVEQALSVLDVPHHTVHGVCSCVLLERGYMHVSGRQKLEQKVAPVLVADLQECLPSSCLQLAPHSGPNEGGNRLWTRSAPLPLSPCHSSLSPFLCLRPPGLCP